MGTELVDDVQATQMIRGFLGLLLMINAIAALAQENRAQTARPASSTASPASARDGQHDFDWEFGNWHTDLWRLKQPLSGFNEWVEYDGTTVVRKIWDGHANLVELEVDGPTRIEGLNLRLYNPETQVEFELREQQSWHARHANGWRIQERPGRVLRSGKFQRTTRPGALHNLGHQNRLLQVRAVVLYGRRQDLGSKLDCDRRACAGMTTRYELISYQPIQRFPGTP